MEMKYVVPDMAQSFGTLEFAGESDHVFDRDMAEVTQSGIWDIPIMCCLLMILQQLKKSKGVKNL